VESGEIARTELTAGNGVDPGLGEKYKVGLGGGCINNAVDVIDRKYGGDVEWPEPDLAPQGMEGR
jgi:hypothetical protein